MQPQQPYSGPPQPPVPVPTPLPTPMPEAPHAANSPVENYNFIINPEKASKRTLALGGGSKIKRVMIVLVGVFILLIIFIVVKNLLVGSGDANVAQLTSVAQEQQELIHLVTNANNNSQQSTLSTSNQNFATTAQLSFTSEQSQLIDYLKLNGHKTNLKELNLKISSAVDTELSASIAASTYDQTFTQVMQTELTTYEEALRAAFSVTHGPKGRQLLSADYQGAELLLEQINSPGS